MKIHKITLICFNWPRVRNFGAMSGPRSGYPFRNEMLERYRSSPELFEDRGPFGRPARQYDSFDHRVLLTSSSAISFPARAALVPRRLEEGYSCGQSCGQSLSSPGASSTTLSSNLNRSFGETHAVSTGLSSSASLGHLALLQTAHQERPNRSQVTSLLETAETSELTPAELAQHTAIRLAQIEARWPTTAYAGNRLHGRLTAGLPRSHHGTPMRSMRLC